MISLFHNLGGTKLENLAIGEKTLREVAGRAGVELRSPFLFPASSAPTKEKVPKREVEHSSRRGLL